LCNFECGALIVERLSGLIDHLNARRSELIVAFARIEVACELPLLFVHGCFGEGRRGHDRVAEKIAAQRGDSGFALFQRNCHHIAENGCNAVNGRCDAGSLQIALAADFQNRHHRKIRQNHRSRDDCDELRSQRLEYPHQRISTSEGNI